MLVQVLDDVKTNVQESFCQYKILFIMFGNNNIEKLSPSSTKNDLLWIYNYKTFPFDSLSENFTLLRKGIGVVFWT